MTCIAAIIDSNGKAYIAGDRGASEGDVILPLEHPKVWRSGDYLLGYYGTMHGEIVQNYFTPPKLSGNPDKFMKTQFRKALKDFYTEWSISQSDNEEFGMLICVAGRIYEHNLADLSMTSYKDLDFMASGSGGSYAMGSLYSTKNYRDPKKRLKIAVECATVYSTSCLAPVDVIG